MNWFLFSASGNYINEDNIKIFNTVDDLESEADEDWSMLKSDDTGEILIAGEHLSWGYINAQSKEEAEYKLRKFLEIR